MSIYQLIDSLLEYGKRCDLIVEEDYYYTLNGILSVLHLTEYETVKEHIELSLDEILDGILSYAIKENIIDNTTESKDLFDTKLMGLLTPRPSEITKKFYELKETSATLATDYFYKLSKDVNYIRSSRISKDIHFDYESEYGTINISINMSKPEKDPNDIKKLLTAKPSSYPRCMLCVENVNYEGRIGFPARQSLRYIPINLNNEKFNIQYSPYSYYNEHLICFHNEHFNMRVDEQTVCELIDFVKQIPHYFIGSNAGLPIVGGSILNHHHFQGGKAILPMENASSTLMKTIDDVDVYKLHWPMSVIRLISKDENKLIEVAKKVFVNWDKYHNESIMIISYDENGAHNAITPIARFKNGSYELDLVLRNNLITKERPLGLYHPREDYWHIKKENIGLIEVMGLAILPSRLNKEMKLVEKYMLNDSLSNEEKEMIEKHIPWANELLNKNNVTKENVTKVIENGIGEVFTKVLKDCAVFNDDAQNEFDSFILEL